MRRASEAILDRRKAFLEVDQDRVERDESQVRDHEETEPATEGQEREEQRRCSHSADSRPDEGKHVGAPVATHPAWLEVLGSRTRVGQHGLTGRTLRGEGVQLIKGGGHVRRPMLRRSANEPRWTRR